MPSKEPHLPWLSILLRPLEEATETFVSSLTLPFESHSTKSLSKSSRKLGEKLQLTGEIPDGRSCLGQLSK
jgi:hypothetical protein